MRMLTNKDLKEFLGLKEAFEKKIEAKLREEGKIRPEERIELEVEWMPYDCMVNVTVYDLDDPFCDNLPRVYEFTFGQLVDNENL